MWPSVFRANRDRKARPVRKGLQARKVLKAWLVLKAPLVRRVSLVQRARKAHKVRKVWTVRQDLKARKVLLARSVPLAPSVRSAPQAQPDRQDRKVKLARRDLQVKTARPIQAAVRSSSTIPATLSASMRRTCSPSQPRAASLPCKVSTRRAVRSLSLARSAISAATLRLAAGVTVMVNYCPLPVTRRCSLFSVPCTVAMAARPLRCPTCAVVPCYIPAAAVG